MFSPAKSFEFSRASLFTLFTFDGGRDGGFGNLSDRLVGVVFDLASVEEEASSLTVAGRPKVGRDAGAAIESG